ncbi:MAG: hisA/hisF family protein [Isosphaera sp.]|nr:hisA/hisF family protein [Isosphaera sp.]
MAEKRPPPRLIPVLDVMGGAVVRAVGGRRDEYRPIESRMMRSVHPTQVAVNLLHLAGAAEFYVADLDAIRGGSEVSPRVDQLLWVYKNPIWVDIGINNLRPAALLPNRPNVRPVVGLETASEPRHLAETLAFAGPRPVAFSIDLKAGRLLGKWADWGVTDDRDAVGLARVAVGLGARALIVLDLARVGTGTGAGTEDVLRAIRAEFSAVDVELIAGGGVKGWADVDRLGDAGADAVLVASALHDGAIRVPR